MHETNQHQDNNLEQTRAVFKPSKLMYKSDSSRDSDDGEDGGFPYVGSSSLRKHLSRVSQTSSLDTVYTKNPLSRLLSRSKNGMTAGDRELSLGRDISNFERNERPFASKTLFTTKKARAKSVSKEQSLSHNSEISYTGKQIRPEDHLNKLTNSTSSIAQFFHRNTGHQNENPKKDTHSRKQLGRPGVALSSQSSNSVVTDSSMALRYRFVSSEPSSTHGAHNQPHPTSLQELHRKYLMSADQFILRKWNKNVAGGSHGTAFRRRQTLNSSGLSEGFQNLSQALEPMFQPTMDKTGSLATPIEFSIELLARFVDTDIVEVVFSPRRPTEEIYEDSEASLDRSNQDDPHEETNEVKLREILQELMNLTRSGLELLRKNWIYIARRGKGERDLGEPKQRLCDLWIMLSDIWQYFNRTIRFTLLQIFVPLQGCLDSDFLLLAGYTSPNHVLESMILLAFKEAVVLPILNMRKSVYFSVSKAQKKSLQQRLIEAEASFILGNFSVHERLIGCIGVLLSYLNASSTLTGEDLTMRDPVLAEAMRWLQDIAL